MSQRQQLITSILINIDHVLFMGQTNRLKIVWKVSYEDILIKNDFLSKECGYPFQTFSLKDLKTLALAVGFQI